VWCIDAVGVAVCDAVYISQVGIPGIAMGCQLVCVAA